MIDDFDEAGSSFFCEGIRYLRHEPSGIDVGVQLDWLRPSCGDICVCWGGSCRPSRGT